DKLSNLPADGSCPDDYQVYFIDGTIPAATCDHPEGPSRNIFQKIFGIGAHRQLVIPPVAQPNPASPAQPSAPNPTAQVANPTDQNQQPSQPEEKPKKRGFWKRVFGIGKE
ncbi:MAG TPA: penicillin-binding protein, partial [Bryobacteraceae bacterium]